MSTLPFAKQKFSVRYNTKQIVAIYYNNQRISLIKYNIERSCFGSGIWKEDKPWLDSEFWKDY